MASGLAWRMRRLPEGAAGLDEGPLALRCVESSAQLPHDSEDVAAEGD